MNAWTLFAINPTETVLMTFLCTSTSFLEPSQGIRQTRQVNSFINWPAIFQTIFVLSAGKEKFRWLYFLLPKQIWEFNFSPLSVEAGFLSMSPVPILISPMRCSFLWRTFRWVLLCFQTSCWIFGGCDRQNCSEKNVRILKILAWCHFLLVLCEKKWERYFTFWQLLRK